MEATGAPDLDGLEQVLRRLPDVTAARVVAGAGGGIAEVHILSLPDKPAKQVVRDVQSAALALMGIDVDRRVVSVVQLDAPAPAPGLAPPPPPPAPPPPAADKARERAPVTAGDRVCLEGVRTDHRGLQCGAEVTLRHGDRTAVGTAEGLMTSSSPLRLVAQATMAALRQLEGAAVRAEVETASVLRFGGRSLALTTVVVVVPPHEEILSGSAVVRRGEVDAVARAVLDATNRRLPELR